jgi:hypothetical protein
MPQVEFEPAIPVFERAKAVHVLDRAASVIGTWNITVLFKYPNDRKICDFIYREHKVCDFNFYKIILGIFLLL